MKQLIAIVTLLLTLNVNAKLCFSMDSQMQKFHKRSQNNEYITDIYELHGLGAKFTGNHAGHGVCRFAHKGYAADMDSLVELFDRVGVSPIITRAYLVKKGDQNYVHVPNSVLTTSGIRQVYDNTYALNEKACNDSKTMDKANALINFKNGKRTNSYQIRSNSHTNGLTLVHEAGVRGELHTFCYFPIDQQ